VVGCGLVPTLAVHAYGFAATFRLKELASAFEGAEVVLEKDQLLARFPPKDGHERLAFFFDFGAMVVAGLEAPDRDRLVRAVTARHGPEPHAPLTEDFLVEVRPGSPLEVQFERVVVPEATPKVLSIIGLLLAQSVAMDYYEEDVREILQRTDTIIGSLQVAGRLPGRVQDLVKFIGSCIATKNGVISTLSLFDKPDAAWEDRELDRLYNALRLELEIDDRFRGLEAKLRMIQENLVLLVDLSQHRSSKRLEVTVVLLILFEVVIMLWQMWRGGGH
jgi:required for meiotic nuclear division protein 1